MSFDISRLVSHSTRPMIGIQFGHPMGTVSFSRQTEVAFTTFTKDLQVAPQTTRLYLLLKDIRFHRHGPRMADILCTPRLIQRRNTTSGSCPISRRANLFRSSERCSTNCRVSF